MYLQYRAHPNLRDHEIGGHKLATYTCIVTSYLRILVVDVERYSRETGRQIQQEVQGWQSDMGNEGLFHSTSRCCTEDASSRRETKVHGAKIDATRINVCLLQVKRVFVLWVAPSPRTQHHHLLGWSNLFRYSI